ncbi:MAG TPA: hypothetical protein VHB02_01335 [Acidimicrobiales bacterium]|nr:hypothetical protein [Acidimicrobiales bacterium]
MRARIAYSLLAIFAATVAMIFVAVAARWITIQALKDLVAPLVTAEVSLLGAVTGFYYGTTKPVPPLGPPISTSSERDLGGGQDP